MEDITGLGKTITELGKFGTKLIGVVAGGTGILYEPIRVKKLIALGVIPDGYKQIVEIKKQPAQNLPAIKDRARVSKNYQECREQQNIEQIINKAFEHMGDQVSDEKVDPDWRTRFFKKAREVSHEKMQEVWGRVLVGEVAKPGSYSLRSLELLSNLNFKEAELFRKISKFVEINLGAIFLTNNNVTQDGFNADFPYHILLEMEDAGLLSSHYSLSLDWDFIPKKGVVLDFKSGHITFLNNTDTAINHRLLILKLTKSGKELLNLVDTEPIDQQYIVDLNKKYPNLNSTYISR